VQSGSNEAKHQKGPCAEELKISSKVARGHCTECYNMTTKCLICRSICL
jgi:hypothetical protein